MRVPSTPVTTPRRTSGGCAGDGTRTAAETCAGNGAGCGSSIFVLISTASAAEEISPRRSCASVNGFRNAVCFAAADSPVISNAGGGVVSMCCTMATGTSSSAHRRYPPHAAHHNEAPTSPHWRKDKSFRDVRDIPTPIFLPKRRKGLLHEVIRFVQQSSPSATSTAYAALSPFRLRGRLGDITPSTPGVSAP